MRKQSIVAGAGWRVGLAGRSPILPELVRIFLTHPLAGRVLKQAFRMGERPAKPLYTSRPQDHRFGRSGLVGRAVYSVRRGGLAGLLTLGLVFGFLASMPVEAVAAAPGLGIVKYAKGTLRVATGDAAAKKDLVASDLVQTGAKIESGADGKAVLRLLPDNAFLEIRQSTAFSLKRVKVKDKRLRRLHMEAGEVVLGLKKKSEAVQCENALTQATASTGKFSCRTDDKGVGFFLVQDGELAVYNRAKDLSVVVRSGQKAVSDLNGIKVSDASDSEMEQVGFRQNTIEVDFVNPETEEFTTLEVEYETNF